MSVKSLNFDLVVVGAGAGGVAASVSAARRGLKVPLLERSGVLGGMATTAHVGTICGLYPRGVKSSELAGEFANEFVERLQVKQGKKEIKTFADELFYLPYESAYFENICQELIIESGVELFLHSTCSDLILENKKIKSLNSLVWNEKVNFVANYFIDATGEGLLSLLAGAEMLEDLNLQAPGFVIRVDNILGDLDEKTLNLLVLKELVGAGREEKLPSSMSYFSVVPGSKIGTSLNLKLAFPVQRKAEFNEITQLEMFGRDASIKAFDYLKANVDQFKSASIGFLAPQLGVRSGKRGVGKEILTSADVLSSRKFHNSIANGLWPIEFWDGDRKAKLEYFDSYYQIPHGAVISKDIENLYFCGRGISADSKPLSSARVIATSFATGSAIAKLI